MPDSTSVVTRMQHNISEFVKHFGSINIELYEVVTISFESRNSLIATSQMVKFRSLHPHRSLSHNTLSQSTISLISRVVHVLQNPHDIGHVLLVADGCADVANKVAAIAASILGRCSSNVLTFHTN